MVYSQGVMLGRGRLIGPFGGCKEIVLAAEGDCISISDWGGERADVTGGGRTLDLMFELHGPQSLAGWLGLGGTGSQPPASLLCAQVMFWGQGKRPECLGAFSRRSIFCYGCLPLPSVSAPLLCLS